MGKGWGWEWGWGLGLGWGWGWCCCCPLPGQYSLQVMFPSLEVKLYGVIRGLQLPSLSLL